MKGVGTTTAVVIGLAVVAGAFVFSKKHAEKRERDLKVKYEPRLAPDVYDGHYEDPIRRPFPYALGPHRNPHTGRLVSQHDPFPVQPAHKAEDFIVSKIVSEFTAEGRLKPEMASSLNKRIHMDYMSEIKHIAMLNAFKTRPLHGRALNEYSHLVLKIMRNHSLYLSPSAKARYEAQTFYVPEAHIHQSLHRVGAANME